MNPCRTNQRLFDSSLISLTVFKPYCDLAEILRKGKASTWPHGDTENRVHSQSKMSLFSIFCYPFILFLFLNMILFCVDLNETQVRKEIFPSAGALYYKQSFYLQGLEDIWTMFNTSVTSFEGQMELMTQHLQRQSFNILLVPLTPCLGESFFGWKRLSQL